MGDAASSMDIVVMGKAINDDGKSEWDTTTFLTGLLTVGELDVASVSDMVNQTIGRVASSKLRKLTYFGHGTDTYFNVGKDVVHSYTPKAHMPAFAKLRPCFAENGFVALCVCSIGKADGLIVELARALGVPVYAFAGDYRPVLDKVSGLAGFGTPVAGYPDGTFKVHVDDPDRRGYASRGPRYQR
jgi:hypothetical protein